MTPVAILYYDSVASKVKVGALQPLTFITVNMKESCRWNAAFDIVTVA